LRRTRTAGEACSGARGHPRTTDTDDLSARLVSRGCHFAARQVLDLSATGVLIAGDDLEVGQVTRFELTGPWLRFRGTAEVMHRLPRRIGLRFVELESVTEEQLYDIVVARLIRSR
jgi:hypothetical protein